MAEELKKRYMRIDEVADRFGVSSRTIRRWWLSGNTCLKAWCPDHRLGNKGLRFLADSVDAFEKGGILLPEEYEEGAQ